MKMGTLCYIEKDNKYLMLHRIKKKNDIHENLWVGLGGKFEAGESPEDCVIREVFEESGLRIQNPRLKGILTFPNNLNQKDWYVFIYVATDFTGEVKQCEEGELAWVEKERISSLPMHDGDYYFMKWMDECPGVFSAKFNYENGVLKDYSLAVY